MLTTPPAPSPRPVSSFVVACCLTDTTLRKCGVSRWSYGVGPALCGWLATAVWQTAARLGEGRLTAFDVVAPFQAAPTPDYLFQLSGLAVPTVAVAAVEWDLRQVAGGDVAPGPSDTPRAPAGGTNHSDWSACGRGRSAPSSWGRIGRPTHWRQRLRDELLTLPAGAPVSRNQSTTVSGASRSVTPSKSSSKLDTSSMSSSPVSTPEAIVPELNVVISSSERATSASLNEESRLTARHSPRRSLRRRWVAGFREPEGDGNLFWFDTDVWCKTRDFAVVSLFPDQSK